MKSRKRGKNTSQAEVLNISPLGIWLLVLQKEYFLPYREFPWFRSAQVNEIFDLEFRRGRYLRWPKLDVDLELESLENLEQYSLVYRA